VKDWPLPINYAARAPAGAAAPTRAARRSTLKARGARHPQYTPKKQDALVSLTELPEDETHSRRAYVRRLLLAKEASGKTFSGLADELGLTNVYTAQLFYGQQQLKPETAERLLAALPELSQADVEPLTRAPRRRFDAAALSQDPLVYRLQEAILHGGDALRALVNEEFGDGIMSAIDFHMTVHRQPGVAGEPRVVVTFNVRVLCGCCCCWGSRALLFFWCRTRRRCALVVHAHAADARTPTCAPMCAHNQTHPSAPSSSSSLLPPSQKIKTGQVLTLR
jgi:cyanate lyase